MDLSDASTAVRTVTKLHGPEWGAALAAAEKVEGALNALDALNVGMARDALREVLDQ